MDSLITIFYWEGPGFMLWPRSTYFWTIAFTFKGGITVVDQLVFFANSSQATRSIPLIHGCSQSLQNVGVGLLKDPSLMGTFSLPPPSSFVEVATVETCQMISSTSSKFKKSSDYFDNEDHRRCCHQAPSNLCTNPFSGLGWQTQIRTRRGFR